MKLFQLGLTSQSDSPISTIGESYMKTVFNGDLSPTSLDQLQVFGNDTFYVKDDTAFMVYSGNGQGDGSGDIDLVFMATNDLTDGSILDDWTRYRIGNPNGDAQPILFNGAGGEWDSQQVLSRVAFFDNDDSLHKMWYIGATAGFYSIGYATSLDGFNWIKHPSNPVLTLNTSIIFFASTKVDGVYHALTGGERNVTTEGVRYSTSPDGVNWTTDPNPKMIGFPIRSVASLIKIGSDFILSCEVGNNYVQSGNYGGIPTGIAYYKTQDFETFTKVSDGFEYIEPQEAGINGMNFIEYNGKYYQFRNYFKNQWKALNGAGNPEGFTAFRVIESDVPPTEITGYNIIYPDYVLKYYPLCDGQDGDETQSPIERINGDAPTVSGVFTWNGRRYAQFTGTQQFIYPDYTTTLNDFSVKVNIEPYDTGVILIAKQDSWELIQNNRKLEVKLYENAILKKHYITTDDIELPPGVWDEGTEVKVGFTFIGGILDLGFGDGLGKAVTKTVDDSMTNISLTGQVQIGELGETNSIRSLVLMTNPTEYQWLYEIDL